MSFKTATKKQLKLRLGIVAPAGAGKTFTALSIARGLVGPQGKIALIDTEHRSAEKYASDFVFDVDYLSGDCAPARYVEKIHEAIEGGYDCLIIDSLTHAWSGPGGALEMVDNAARNSKGNSYVAWRNVTPEHNRLVTAMLSAPLHVIATLRAKTEYVLETNAQGKQIPRKVGMAPIQREGMDYEFDVVGDMDHDHAFVVTKTRCASIDGKAWVKPGSNSELVKHLRAWLDEGTPYVPEQQPEEAVEPERTPRADLSEQFTRMKSARDAIFAARDALQWENKDVETFALATIGKKGQDANITELETLAAAITEQVSAFSATSTPETARTNAPRKEKTNA